MDAQAIEKQIGEAWRAHRQGQNDTAKNEFLRILEHEPGNIDALYGLGLTQRTNGDFDAARETFEKLATMLKEMQDQEASSGQPGRFYMLSNMVRQQVRLLEMHQQ